MLKADKITDQIMLVSTDTQEALGLMFLRFQEYYESPEWRGKIFTLGQFRAWYSSYAGQNSYQKDWTGFNIPSYVLVPFIQGLFDPLTPAEQEFLELFRYRQDRFYIIGAQAGDPETLDHEICHGLYYTNDKYRSAVDRVLEEDRQILLPVRRAIKDMMYHPEVIDDEVHAYTSVGTNDLEGVIFPQSTHRALRKIKNRYYK